MSHWTILYFESTPRNITTLAVIFSASLAIFLWFHRQHRSSHAPSLWIHRGEKSECDEPRRLISTETASPKPKKMSKAQAAKKDAKTKRRQARKEAEAAVAASTSPEVQSPSATTTTSTASVHADPQILLVLEDAADIPEEARVVQATGNLDALGDKTDEPGFGSTQAQARDCGHGSGDRSPRTETSSPSPSETTTSTNTTGLTAESSSLILTPPASSVLGLDTGAQQEPDASSPPAAESGVQHVAPRGEDASHETMANISPQITKEVIEFDTAKEVPPSAQSMLATPSQAKTSPNRTSATFADHVSPAQAGANSSITTTKTSSKHEKPSVATPPSSSPLPKANVNLITHGPHAMFERSQSQPPVPPPKPHRSTSGQGSSGGVGLGLPSASASGSSTAAGPSSSTVRSTSNGNGSPSSRTSYMAPRHLRRHQEQSTLDRIIQTQPGSPVIVNPARNSSITAFSPPGSNLSSPIVAGGMATFYPRPVPVPWNIMYGGPPYPAAVFQQQPAMMYPPHHVHAPVSTYPGGPIFGNDSGRQNGEADANDESDDEDDDDDDVILVSIDDRREGEDDMAVDFPTLNPSPQPKSRPTSMLIGASREVDQGRTSLVENGAMKDVDGPEFSISVRSTPEISVPDGTLRSDSRSSGASSSSASSTGPSTKPNSIAPPTTSTESDMKPQTPHLHPLAVPVGGQQYYPSQSLSPFTPNGGYSPLQLPHPHFMRSTSTPSPIPMMPSGWYSPNAWPNQGVPYPQQTWVPPPAPSLQESAPGNGEGRSANTLQAPSSSHLAVNGGSSAPRSRSSSPCVPDANNTKQYGTPNLSPMPMGYQMQQFSSPSGQGYAYQYGPPSPYVMMSPPPIGMVVPMSMAVNGFSTPPPSSQQPQQQPQPFLQVHPGSLQQPQQHASNDSREWSSLSSESSVSTDGGIVQPGSSPVGLSGETPAVIILNDGHSQQTISIEGQ
ncbi:hypothetical protein FRB93_001183 [Tulasnella sp. JGI-2019a]|nr:hypothetical protein FRB93_001183 [Tulasnella sp. JGI-2019a]